MRAHFLQHVPFEGLGTIAPWLDAAGYAVTGTRLYEQADFPDPALVNLLVVMGGPMSVNDERELPWLVDEKRFVRACVARGTAVLGVCLGAQLIASAMGARVFPNREKEIGWFPIEAVPPAGEGTFRFPAAIEVFHWHGETFDLPEGATLLARSQACEHQAFQIGRSTIGLQFHLETTPESSRLLVENCRNELVPAPFIQPEQQLLREYPERFRTIHTLMGDVLSYLTAHRA